MVQDSEKDKLSNRHFLEVIKPISVSLHGLQYLLDGVAGQDDKVDQQQGPKHIDLDHLEVRAYCAQNEGKSCSLPDLHLSQCAH